MQDHVSVVCYQADKSELLGSDNTRKVCEISPEIPLR